MPRRVPPAGPETGERVAQVLGLGLGVVVVVIILTVSGQAQLDSVLRGLSLAGPVVLLGALSWSIVRRLRRRRRYRQRKEERLHRQGVIARRL